MNEQIVMFPTLKDATVYWIKICEKYKVIITKKSKYPLSITLLNGDKWIFHAETEGKRNLLGYHGKIYFDYELKILRGNLLCQNCKYADFMRNNNGYIVGMDCAIQGCEYERKD